MSVAELIESNLIEFLLSMGAAGGGDTRSDRVVTWTVGGSPIGYHNAVVRCRADRAAATGLVHEWLDELRARQVPGSWHLSPAMAPGDLAEILGDAGFADGGEEPAMAIELAGIASTPPPAADDLHIRLVRSADDLVLYNRVLAAGFGEGPKEADWVTSVWTSIGLGEDAPWQHLIGLCGDEAVATTSVLMTGATGGIYFVSTHPDWRRHGFGAAITHRALLEAQGRGATLAVVGSSPMGHAVYERLGFRTVFSYRLFECEP